MEIIVLESYKVPPQNQQNYIHALELDIYTNINKYIIWSPHER